VVVAVLLALNLAGCLALLSREVDSETPVEGSLARVEREGTGTRTREPTEAPEEEPTEKPTEEPTEEITQEPTEEITVEGAPFSAQSFETVKISGVHPSGSGSSALRVQRQQGFGWVTFPLPVVTDDDGRFDAYVELGEPGRYRLRVLEPETRTTSDVFTLDIR
jgi:hypothetical protein